MDPQSLGPETGLRLLLIPVVPKVPHGPPESSFGWFLQLNEAKPEPLVFTLDQLFPHLPHLTQWCHCLPGVQTQTLGTLLASSPSLFIPNIQSINKSWQRSPQNISQVCRLSINSASTQTKPSSAFPPSPRPAGPGQETHLLHTPPPPPPPSRALSCHRPQ